MWSRTYIVAKTASRKKLIQSLLRPAQQRGIGAHQERKGLAVAELVVAPPFEPAKDRMKLPLGMALKLAKDRDVAGIADLLGQISGVEDEFRLEEGIFLGARKKAEIDADAEFPSVLR